MSKIALVFEVPGMTSKKYDAIMEELLAQHKLPNPHVLSHAAFQKGDGWCVVDVWESQESCMEFGQNALFPIFQQLGLKIEQPKFYAVHNFIGAGITEAVHA